MIITQALLGVDSTAFDKSLYCKYSVWCYFVSRRPLLETIFQDE